VAVGWGVGQQSYDLLVNLDFEKSLLFSTAEMIPPDNLGPAMEGSSAFCYLDLLSFRTSRFLREDWL
jgi:hypothetical protein